MSREELASTLWRFHLAGPERQCTEILAAGYRKLVLDDATVERVALKLFALTDSVALWIDLTAVQKKRYRLKARAVLAAAVEAGQ